MYIEKLFCDLGGHLRYGAAAALHSAGVWLKINSDDAEGEKKCTG